jgi:hypothetical protein
MADGPRLDELISTIKQRHPDDDPLGQLADAVVLGDHLGELADHLIGHFVDHARHSGASWREIGRSMGVTKQAAQKRFVAKAGAQAPLPLRPFTRYTDEARRVVVAAQEEARSARHAYIGPEHLLLALVSDPAMAHLVEALGATPDAVRAAVRSEPGSGDARGGHIPFSPPAKQALELGHETADELGSERIGPEHLLLGLLSLPDDPIVAELAALGVSRVGVLPEALRLAGRPQA